MIKNSLKALVAYIIVLIICIIIMNLNCPSFPYAMIVYGESYVLLGISSILFILLGMFFKIQDSIMKDFISLIGLGLLLCFGIIILLLDYDYMLSIYHQNTPELRLFSQAFLSEIATLCIPLSWFIRLPEFHKGINKFFIILTGLYPTLLLFGGLQLKRLVIKK